jgi:hypothetical protein
MRYCKAISDDEDSFVVERAGKRVASWPASVFAGETELFEILHVDLDGDGRRELIVADHTGTSCGMGVDYWKIHIFADPEFRRPQEPLVFDIEEFGAFGNVVPMGRSILILTTKWVGADDPQGKRDMGTYLFGQWWSYKGGELIPARNSPLVGRRYLQVSRISAPGNIVIRQSHIHGSSIGRR